jgi:hypothetical protein
MLTVLCPTANVGIYFRLRPAQRDHIHIFLKVLSVRFFPTGAFSTRKLFFVGHITKGNIKVCGQARRHYSQGVLLQGLFDCIFLKAILVRLYRRAFCIFSVRPANLSGRLAVIHEA